MAARTLTVALVALVGGCGGEDRLSKAEYESRMQRVAATLQTATDRLGGEASDPRDTQAAARALAGMGQALDRAADGVADLEPPEDVEKPHDSFVAGLRAFAGDMRKVAALARRGDRLQIQAFANGLGSLASTRRIASASEEIKRKGYDIAPGG